MINQTLRDQLIDAYIATIPLVTLNLFWFIASLPIVTIVPATAALLYSTNLLAHGKPADLRTFFEGFRQYFWRSWPWGILNILVVTVLLSNFIFYGQYDEAWSVWARAIVVTLAFLWLAVQVYTFPLMIEQEKPHLRTALRNSLVVLLSRPVYSIGIALVIVAIAAVSTLVILPLWIFISASTCAYLANRATVSSIARFARKTDPSQPSGESDRIEA